MKPRKSYIYLKTKTCIYAKVYHVMIGAPSDI